jgi:hypothetical protein
VTSESILCKFTFPFSSSGVWLIVFEIKPFAWAQVGRSEDYTSTDLALNPPIVEGQPNPIRRDTVQIGGGSSATLRIVADHPGVWLFHCKFSLHLKSDLLHHQVTGISNPVSPYNSLKHLQRPKKPRSPPAPPSSIPNAPLIRCLTPAMLQDTTLRLT